MTFTWDPKKAEENLKKHGVDFREAATVFDDTLSTTFPDARHSTGESDSSSSGCLHWAESSSCHIPKPRISFESSAPEPPQRRERTFSKKANPTPSDEMRPEYDFASMKGGVRGKYAGRAREGTKIVLIQPEVADAFPTERAVNEALKGVLNTTRAVRSTGGLYEERCSRRCLARSSLERRRPGGEISGIVGIIAIGGSQFGATLAGLLAFSVAINLNLAIFNLLPLPPLDGGRIAFAVLGKIYRRTVRIQAPLTLAGWACMLALMVYATIQDLGRIGLSVLS